METYIEIEAAPNRFDSQTGSVTGEKTSVSVKRLCQLKGVFADGEAFAASDPETVAYRVECHFPVSEGTEGGLFFGTSYVMPGKVGREYFMTKGHYHAKIDCAEYYWGLSGEGVLLLMDQSGKCRAEKVEKGSLHFIPGRIAHRLVNVGSGVLAVGACWPSDAGHDYGSIETTGFGVRVVEIEGNPVIIKA